MEIRKWGKGITFFTCQKWKRKRNPKISSQNSQSFIIRTCEKQACLAQTNLYKDIILQYINEYEKVLLRQGDNKCNIKIKM